MGTQGMAGTLVSVRPDEGDSKGGPRVGVTLRRAVGLDDLLPQQLQAGSPGPTVCRFMFASSFLFKNQP